MVPFLEEREKFKSVAICQKLGDTILIVSWGNFIFALNNFQKTKCKMSTWDSPNLFLSLVSPLIYLCL